MTLKVSKYVNRIRNLIDKKEDLLANSNKFPFTR